MWCTRWFLPLLLLPLPTAPPFFLILFVFSLTLHAKPCFYCVVLISTLFISSCYWQPLPIESPLSVPWADNITTFADALASVLAPNYTQPLPSMIRPVDRCWCASMSSGGFFQPFNISRWEYQSVMRLKDELEHQHPPLNASAEEGKPQQSPPSTSAPNRLPLWLSQSNLPTLKDLWASHRKPEPVQQTPAPTPPPKDQTQSDAPLSFLPQEYDLRQYGLDLIIDFSWSS